MNNHRDKEMLVSQILEHTEQLIKKFSDGDDEEKQWLIKTVDSPVLKSILPNMTVLMLHVLDAIGKYEPVNSITISNKMDIPKGTVSKITRKLIELQLIKGGRLPNNKKEIIFQTTTLGNELFETHKELHTKIEKNMIRFLSQYESHDLNFVTNLLENMLKQSWIE